MSMVVMFRGGEVQFRTERKNIGQNADIMYGDGVSEAFIVSRYH